ncbi:unknown [Bacteroides sp. CAG:754]|jgi:hypothetical protein|nr:unknown [Bacteroides sp. CAG:754]
MTKDSPKTKFSDYFFVLYFAFVKKFLFFCRLKNMNNP